MFPRGWWPGPGRFAPEKARPFSGISAAVGGKNRTSTAVLPTDAAFARPSLLPLLMPNRLSRPRLTGPSPHISAGIRRGEQRRQRRAVDPQQVISRVRGCGLAPAPPDGGCRKRVKLADPVTSQRPSAIQKLWCMAGRCGPLPIGWCRSIRGIPPRCRIGHRDHLVSIRRLLRATVRESRRPGPSARKAQALMAASDSWRCDRLQETL